MLLSLRKKREKVEQIRQKFIVLHCSEQSVAIARVCILSLFDEATIDGTEIHIPEKYKT